MQHYFTKYDRLLNVFYNPKKCLVTESKYVQVSNKSDPTALKSASTALICADLAERQLFVLKASGCEKLPYSMGVTN